MSEKELLKLIKYVSKKYGLYFNQSYEIILDIETHLTKGAKA